MVKTREQLERDIKALEDAGLDASEEKAQLKQLVLAGVPAPAKAKVKTPAPAPVEEEAYFIPLNLESFRTGGGGWTAPATTGVKDAVCEGYMIPDFVEDQLWFIFTSPAGVDEPFRGAFVCAAITRVEKSGAFKVKSVLDALNVPYEEDEEQGGIKLLTAPKGKSCQVLWDDIVIKGKTERRIQDVMMPGVEAAM